MNICCLASDVHFPSHLRKEATRPFNRGSYTGDSVSIRAIDHQQPGIEAWHYAACRMLTTVVAAQRMWRRR